MKPFLAYKDNIIIGINSVQCISKLGLTPQYLGFSMQNGRNIRWIFDTQKECDCVFEYLKHNYANIFNIQDLDIPFDNIDNL